MWSTMRSGRIEQKQRQRCCSCCCCSYSGKIPWLEEENGVPFDPTKNRQDSCLNHFLRTSCKAYVLCLFLKLIITLLGSCERTSSEETIQIHYLVCKITREDHLAVEA
ncbi:unnamed protein product [Eruca vesicaria subsp. sativa]|uniref:Uncharacterized protein n=1 Tax=Eruca vesicaria subsp. sativa TaxID=29727 RepID=A0ABC8JME0_ERUVS|nr:unnamed protein product [Eruca vesicaria subsp. sativa]